MSSTDESGEQRDVDRRPTSSSSLPVVATATAKPAAGGSPIDDVIAVVVDRSHFVGGGGELAALRPIRASIENDPRLQIYNE